ncbi:MAG: hypothetical protein C4519_25970 [Desulfobacteraceae bacterium]|nr:MAG: hypothetical protein C4519_25970 [Desulfobacteraceae bacterium]
MPREFILKDTGMGKRPEADQLPQGGSRPIQLEGQSRKIEPGQVVQFDQVAMPQGIPAGLADQFGQNPQGPDVLRRGLVLLECAAKKLVADRRPPSR